MFQSEELSSHRICLSDDVEVGVSDPCYIYGSQTLMLINGGYISAVTEGEKQRSAEGCISSVTEDSPP